jgi:uncharacterized phage infection (PIP) family protein YhgE
MMENKRVMKRRRAVAQAIVVFLLVIILAGALYVPLNYAVTQFASLQSSGILSGYDSDTLSFVQTFWIWLPITLLFAAIPFVYLRAQKRGIGD